MKNLDKKVFTVLNDQEPRLLAKCPVLVTGGARRIGKAIVEDLAAHGFPVAIHYNHSIDEGAALAASINEQGGKACVVRADLSSESDIRNLVQDASRQIGPIQLLVNNASLFEDDRIGQLDMTLWDKHFAIHLKAPVLLAEEMAKALPDGEEALVVNVIDQRVWKLNPNFFSYTLSKTALWNDGTSACSADSGQCNSTWSNIAERTAEARRFRTAGRETSFATCAGIVGIWAYCSLFLGKPLRHRPDDRT